MMNLNSRRHSESSFNPAATNTVLKSMNNPPNDVEMSLHFADRESAQKNANARMKMKKMIPDVSEDSTQVGSRIHDQVSD